MEPINLILKARFILKPRFILKFCLDRLLLLSSLAVVQLISFALPATAADWRLGMGVHDYYVDEADSHTFGAQVSVAVEGKTDSNISLHGQLSVYMDRDKDDLDPDHIPIWFSSAYGAEGTLMQLSSDSHLTWDLTLAGKRNTVSSVEKQIKLFPTLGYLYQGDTFSADLKLGAGYYFLEIDDDVPRMRGYDRGDFQNKTGAYTLAAGTQFALSQSLIFAFSGQHWNDGDTWLENELVGELSYDASHWKQGSQLVLSLNYTHYNLAPYDKVPTTTPGYLPILPWSNDLLVLIYFEMPWG